MGNGLTDLVVVPDGFDAQGGEDSLKRPLVRSSCSGSFSNLARVL
jgi:hypothetical protein